MTGWKNLGLFKSFSSIYDGDCHALHRNDNIQFLMHVKKVKSGQET